MNDEKISLENLNLQRFQNRKCDMKLSIIPISITRRDYFCTTKF